MSFALRAICVIALHLIQFRIIIATIDTGLPVAVSAAEQVQHRSAQMTQINSKKLMAGIELTVAEKLEGKTLSEMITKIMYTDYCRRFVAVEPTKPAVCFTTLAIIGP